jgi:dipeptidyl aminopeptidase/acylaminoacyl peptidase
MQISKLLLLAAAGVAGAAGAQRSLALDDLARVQDVGNPQVSPDGKWVAYTVATTDKTADKHVTNLWMVSWDGTQKVQLTYETDGASAPRWSPDGRYISFLSSRSGAAKGTQVWVMERVGGEARQFTALKEKISGYEWSPDSKRLALILRKEDEPPAEAAKPGAPPLPPKPMVIDRYHFKQDVEGYLTGSNRSRIFLYDTVAKKTEALTTDAAYDESNPAWSPDGSKIAFVSNRDAQWDRTRNTDVFVAEAQPGSKITRLTTFAGPDGGRLAWSPDGRQIAYVQGSDPKFSAYNLNRLAIVAITGGSPRLLTEKLDRGVTNPVFSEDGHNLLFLVQDDRNEYPASIAVDGDPVERLMTGPRVVGNLIQSGGHTAVLAATADRPPEVFAMEGGSLRKLTSQNDEQFAEIKLGATEEFTSKSKDGTEVHGLLTLPPSYEKGKKYPALLRIHGGPNGQDAHAFQFERQFLAANGYVVLNVNYRGSSGRGKQFSESIFADWGDKEVIDLLGAVDRLVAMGIADPDRLGIGGWSYGGILTDYTIASDSRFKAAISGAGSANQISMYGIDQYAFQYDNEIGAPWKNSAAWMKISYPFFHADRIKTPTLFLGGEKDFNVPVTGGEQMYQALQSLGVPAELVIYPGQFHGLTRPSFIRDRLERYVAWYDKYLKTPATVAASRP